MSIPISQNPQNLQQNSELLLQTLQFLSQTNGSISTPLNSEFTVNFTSGNIYTNLIPAIFDSGNYIQILLNLEEEKIKQLQNSSEKQTKIKIKNYNFDLVFSGKSSLGEEGILYAGVVVIINDCELVDDIVECGGECEFDNNRQINVGFDESVVAEIKRRIMNKIKESNLESGKRISDVLIVNKEKKYEFLFGSDASFKAPLNNIIGQITQNIFYSVGLFDLEINNADDIKDNIFTDGNPLYAPKPKKELIEKYMAEIPNDFKLLLDKYKNTCFSKSNYNTLLSEIRKKDENKEKIKINNKSIFYTFK